MDTRPLGRTGLMVSHVGWGTVKIGRNIDVKFPKPFDLPTDAEACRIIEAMLDLGITLIDTAPAYGLAESRLGQALRGRRDEVVLCTKVGEYWDDGRSRHDFSGASAESGLHESLKRLGTDAVDVLLVHSDGNDLAIQRDTDLVEAMQRLKRAGLARSIGMSAKTPEGTAEALGWADVVMCTYSHADQTHQQVIRDAAARGCGVLLKKVLGSGHLDAEAALRFVLHESPIAADVSCAVIGSLDPDRMRRNVAASAQPTE
ncbi:MAG: aldo/keto reductase [Phycisphaerales bacterium]|jgi:aryl-alcohol dehydrogenase-like predicted oxidoreductase|nr:aldo/keto reductase [Phycisphaerales bacterium]